MARASDDQDDVVFKSKAAERCIGTHWDRIPSVAKAASVCGTARTIWPCLQRAHTSSGRTGRNGEKLEEMKPAVSDRCQRLKHQANRCCSGGWWRCQMPIPPAGRLSGFGTSVFLGKQSSYQRAGTIRSQFPLPISENIFVMTSHYSGTGTGTRI